MDSDFKNLVVIGASAGGIKAVGKCVQGIPRSVDAAFVVVIHVSANSNAQAIVSMLQQKTFLACEVAETGKRLEKGHLYLAPPDMQLMVDGPRLLLVAGAYENKFRPSVDVLFRSAAVVFENRTIGIILTGMLNDGTSGMWAVKQCGGVCVVQDPTDAEFAEMPRNALHRIEADHVVGIDEMANLATKLIRLAVPDPVTVPESLRAEVEITKNRDTSIKAMDALAPHSDFSCPDCGGRLWTISEGKNRRYRCHTGHVYDENLLDALQDSNIKQSVVIAIRMMEEKADFLEQMVRRTAEANGKKNYYAQRLDGIRQHIEQLKSLMVLLHRAPQPAEAP